MRAKVVPEVLSGDKQIALMITEPHAGSDVQGLTTTAEMSDDGKEWIVNGEKKWWGFELWQARNEDRVRADFLPHRITCGGFATYFTTAVRTGGAGGAGISILLIERSPGLTTRHVYIQSSTLTGTAFVTLEDVRVPVADMIGKVNQGFKALILNLWVPTNCSFKCSNSHPPVSSNHERLVLGTKAVRMSRLVYADALHYAHRRKTFGKLLIEHPVIREKFAQMARQIESTAAWGEHLFYQMQKIPDHIKDERLGGACALFKLQGTRTIEYCAREAAQIMGGIGYTRGGQGGRVERLYREVRGLAIPGGSEEIM